MIFYPDSFRNRHCKASNKHDSSACDIVDENLSIQTTQVVESLSQQWTVLSWVEKMCCIFFLTTPSQNQCYSQECSQLASTLRVPLRKETWAHFVTWKPFRTLKLSMPKGQVSRCRVSELQSSAHKGVGAWGRRLRNAGSVRVTGEHLGLLSAAPPCCLLWSEALALPLTFKLQLAI